MDSKKPRKKNKRMNQCVAGIFLAIITSIAMLMIAPIFIINEYIEPKNLWLVALLIHVIATFTMAFVIINRSKEGNILPAIISVITWFLVMTISGSVLFPGLFEHILASLGSCLFGLFGAVLIKNMLENQKKYAKGRRRSK